MKIPILQTDRLRLVPLRLADAVQAQPLFARWEIVQHLNHLVRWPFPEDGVEAYYRDVALPAMSRREEFHWTLRLKTEPERLIGSIGLMVKTPIHRGFWMGLPWQGQGLMTEAVVAVNDFWFGVLKQPLLRTTKATANRTSRRVSEKTGMRLVGKDTGQYVSGALASETWEITAEEWAAWKMRHLAGSKAPEGSGRRV